MSLHTAAIAVLDPQGVIAAQERDLIIIASVLGLLVVIPVFIMTFLIVWKYREHKGARYTPEWDHNLLVESIWWGIPCLIILALSVITWTSSHRLDPFKPLASTTRPMTIQVVALPWRWLFIYPEQGIATMNYVQFPEQTPVRFEITADAPMNSFWIPKLGGQIYAMTGMSTELHLMADGPGDYRGSSANLSGAGFAGMNFTARSSSLPEFSDWVQQVKTSSATMDVPTYNKVSQPNRNNKPSYYSWSDPGLYDAVIQKYLGPIGVDHDMHMAGVE